MSEFVEALQMSFMQRALLAGLLMAVICPIVGTFLVLRRLSLIADGLGHISFAGLALGLMLQWQPLVAALLITGLGTLGIEHLRATRKAAGDVAIAIVSAAGLALGAILSGFHPNTDVMGFLFGSLVAVHPSDLRLIGLLGLTVLLLIAVTYRGLVAITIDEEGATASGLPVRQLNFVFMLATAVTVVAAVRVVGILLVSSLLVIPVAASMQLFRGIFLTLAGSIVISLLSVAGGLWIAFQFNLATGGTIVLILIASFFAASLWAALRTRSASMRGVMEVE